MKCVGVYFFQLSICGHLLRKDIKNTARHGCTTRNRAFRLMPQCYSVSLGSVVFTVQEKLDRKLGVRVDRLYIPAPFVVAYDVAVALKHQL